MMLPSLLLLPFCCFHAAAGSTITVGEALEVKLAALPPAPWWPASARVTIHVPSNEAVTVAGFEMTNYSRTLQNHTVTRWNQTIKNVWSESLIQNGSPAFFFRFTPMKPGAYSWTADMSIANQSSQTRGVFSVVAAAPPPRGFARVSANKQYFEFEDGSPLYLIGGNIECWDCVLASKPAAAPTPDHP